MPSSPTIPPTCTHLKNPNPYTTSLALLILIGILISYLPQHIKLLTRRSSAGLSPWWVLLGGLGSLAALANILVLPRSREDVRCCASSEVTGWECAAAMGGVGQIGLQWGCFMVIVMLYLTFHPSSTSDSTSSTSPSQSPSHPQNQPIQRPPPLSTKPPPSRKEPLIVSITIVTATLCIFLLSLAILLIHPLNTKPPSPIPQTWANILGTTASILSIIQWVPQLYYTYRLQSVASLSILTMLIQVPGAFLFALSLWLRLGWEGWSTWLVFVVTGVLQSGLLGMAVVFWWRGKGVLGVEVREEVEGLRDEVRGDGYGDANGDDGFGDERTGLLNGHEGGRKGYESTDAGGGRGARAEAGGGSRG